MEAGSKGIGSPRRLLLMREIPLWAATVIGNSRRFNYLRFVHYSSPICSLHHDRLFTVSCSFTFPEDIRSLLPAIVSSATHVCLLNVVPVVLVLSADWVTDARLPLVFGLRELVYRVTKKEEEKSEWSRSETGFVDTLPRCELVR